MSCDRQRMSDIFLDLCAFKRMSRRSGALPLPKAVERRAKTLGYNTMRDWASADPEPELTSPREMQRSDFSV